MLIKFTYPYNSKASINQCFNRGMVRYGYINEVRGWKSGLTLVARNALQGQIMHPPVQIAYIVHYPYRTRVLDAQSFSKIVQDAVVEALGFDDNSVRVASGPYIGIRLEDKKAHGFLEIFAWEIPKVVSALPLKIKKEMLRDPQ